MGLRYWATLLCSTNIDRSLPSNTSKQQLFIFEKCGVQVSDSHVQIPRMQGVFVREELSGDIDNSSVVSPLI